MSQTVLHSANEVHDQMANPPDEAKTVADATAKGTIVSLLPQYFLMFVTLLYASGFLVVLAYLDRYGIREAGADFWKARYIHTGILVLALPVMVHATILALRRVMNHPRSDLDIPKMRWRLWPVLILLINLEIVLYVLIMLTRGGQAGTTAVGLGPAQWVIVMTLGGLVLVLLVDRVTQRFVNDFSKPNATVDALLFVHRLTVTLRWTLVTVVLALDIWFFSDFAGHLAGFSLWIAGLYLGFGAICGIVIETLFVYEHRPTSRANIASYRTIAFCVTAPMYYLMLFAFAYGVFPFIPAARGGGDYSSSPKAVINFKDATTRPASLSTYLTPGNANSTKPLVVVEETAKGLYVADPAEAGGPAEWRAVRAAKPKLLFLTSDTIGSMELESRSRP